MVRFFFFTVKLSALIPYYERDFFLLLRELRYIYIYICQNTR